MIRTLLATCISILLLVLAAAPPVAAQGGPGAPDSTATAPRRRPSWTSDRLRLGVGDVVTVLIDERTLASAILSDQDASRRGSSLDMNISTPGGASSAASVRSGQDGDSRRSGQAMRQNDFRSEMSARVVAVSPGGMLQLKGEKRVQLDQNTQTVTVTGWVRPQDIATATNTVESSRLADAEIAYTQDGALGKPKRGILTRVLGIIWP